MKKRILLMLMIISLFTLTACSEKKQSSVDALKFKEEYESLNGTKREKDGKIIRTIEFSKDNPFIYKEASDIVEMIENKETFVVYFGFSDCPWCRSMLPNLISVAEYLELDTIYYVDVKEIRDTMEVDSNGNITTTKEGTSGYYEVLAALDSVLEDYTLKDVEGNLISTGEKRIYAPNIISVVDGIAVELTDGISEHQTDGYMELTSEMNQESYDKIKCAIQCVADDKNVCSAKTSC